VKQEPAVPRQMPATLAQFAGRSTELTALSALLDKRTNAGGMVVISAIGGTAVRRG
jgi:hypothetical protein